MLEIENECITRAVHLHVAEIERDFISARTKEAMAKRKTNGVKLGRPLGPSKNLRLDLLADKIDKRPIAKLLDVSPNMLYAWLKLRRPVVSLE